MMNSALPQHKELAALAHHYNTKSFIERDPVQFPRRYTSKLDIEISAFVTAWISWGNRNQIIRTANYIDTQIFCGEPYKYLCSRQWEQYQSSTQCFYRTCRYNDFYHLMQRLQEVYSAFADMEECVRLGASKGLSYAEALSQQFIGISGIADASKKSPCKRLWFFLRWMVRRDGIVDIGIWPSLDPEKLVIPLDTHVFHMARQLQITLRRTADIRAAIEITDFFRTIFPHDPALGDFALFGYGEEHGI